MWRVARAPAGCFYGAGRQVIGTITQAVLMARVRARAMIRAPARRPARSCRFGPALPGQGRRRRPGVPRPGRATRSPAPTTRRCRAGTLIVHATILDGAGHRIDDGEVLLRDGKVAAVGPRTSPTRGRAGDRRPRALGHAGDHRHPQPRRHLCPAADRGRRRGLRRQPNSRDPNAAGTWIETAVNPQDPAFARALASGVTTLQILPGSTPDLRRPLGGRCIPSRRRRCRR